MSIINDKNVSINDQRLFLGPTMGLQRYDVHKYPIFFELFKKQLGFYWRPEEFALTKDRVDYQEMEDHEKHIFTSNLLFQTMLDSIVARGVPTFLDKITSPELEACCSAWQFFELIHSYSYTYIIKNLYADPTKILDSALENPEILKRSHSVKQAYDDLNKAVGEDARAKIYLALISVNMLEAVRFYVSFVSAFAFAENKKMVGNADIVRSIRRDECLSKDTELLTPKGWKNIAEITKEDKVAQFNRDKTIEFVYPVNISSHFAEVGYHFKNRWAHVDILTSEKHRMIFEHLPTKEIREQTSEEFTPYFHKKILCSGKIKSAKETKLTALEKFFIALQADGHLDEDPRRTGTTCGFKRTSFTFSKQRKIERLKGILNECGFEYNILGPYNKKQEYVFDVKVPDEYRKKYFNWIDLSNINYSWCVDFIEELSHWDGSIDNENNSLVKYGSVVKENREIAQIIAALSGYRTTIGIYKNPKLPNSKDYYTLNINRDNDGINCEAVEKTKVIYNDYFYGIEVPSGMLMIRRNGRISMTGNSVHLYTTQNIINILRNNPEEGFQSTIKDYEDYAIKIFKEGADEEKAWASYLFKDGSILGLNEKILSQYVEWLVDSRMEQIGLPKLFNVKKPNLSWLQPWLDGASLQPAPQETEITSYKIGASSNDVDGMDLSEFSL